MYAGLIDSLLLAVFSFPLIGFHYFIYFSYLFIFA